MQRFTPKNPQPKHEKKKRKTNQARKISDPKVSEFPPPRE